MSSYRRLDSTGSNVGSGGGSRFRLGLSPSKPAAEQEGKQRENADAREDALAHSFRAEFPSLMSPHKSGFLRLDSNDEEDDSCSAEETEATETKTKKHYLKFLGRARKRIGSVSRLCAAQKCYVFGTSGTHYMYRILKSISASRYIP